LPFIQVGYEEINSWKQPLKTPLRTKKDRSFILWVME